MKRIKKYNGCETCRLLRTCKYSACAGKCDNCTSRCCLCVADCTKCHLACDNRTLDYYNPSRNL